MLIFVLPGNRFYLAHINVFRIAKAADGTQKMQEFLMEGQHYELIPEAAWDKFVSWYTLAPDSIPLARLVIGPSVSPMVSLMVSKQLL